MKTSNFGIVVALIILVGMPYMVSAENIKECIGMNNKLVLAKSSEKIVATTFDSPLSDYAAKIIQKFGAENKSYGNQRNLGEDLNLPQSTPIKSVADGKIIFIGPYCGYSGLVAVVEYDLGFDHLFKLTVGSTKTVTTRTITVIYGNVSSVENQDSSGARLYWQAGDIISRGHTIGYATAENFHMGLRLTENPGAWVYFKNQNTTDFPESDIMKFAAFSEIIAQLPGTTPTIQGVSQNITAVKAVTATTVATTVSKTAQVAKDTMLPIVRSMGVSPAAIFLGDELVITYNVSDNIALGQVELWTNYGFGWNQASGKVNSATGTSSSGTFRYVPTKTGAIQLGLHVVDKAGNWNTEGSAGPKTVTVQARPIAGWSNITGYKHAETAVQRAVIASVKAGDSPQSIHGSPWLTDYQGDGSNMINVIKEFDSWYRAQNPKPILPAPSIPASLRTKLIGIMTTGPGHTYTVTDAGKFVDHVRQVYNPSIALPTSEDQVLKYLQIRAQCKEYADRIVIAANGKAKPYASATVSSDKIRPGMYAFLGSSHATVILAVEWDKYGNPINYRFGEANWPNSGLPWNSPPGEVPWERHVRTDRTYSASSYRVVSSE